jgi:hypothetical protein
MFWGENYIFSANYYNPSQQGPPSSDVLIELCNIPLRKWLLEKVKSIWNIFIHQEPQQNII